MLIAIKSARNCIAKTFTERKQKGDFTGRYGPSVNSPRPKLPLFEE
ncbi:MAG: hypothetical protein V2A61_05220 [Calditrichota bacterium]